MVTSQSELGGGRFGSSIDFDGNTLVVGETSGKTIDTVNSVGTVQVFSKSN